MAFVFPFLAIGGRLWNGVGLGADVFVISFSARVFAFDVGFSFPECWLLNVADPPQRVVDSPW